MQNNVFVGVKPKLTSYQDMMNSMHNSKVEIMAKNQADLNKSTKYDYLLLPITSSRYKDIVDKTVKAYRAASIGDSEHSKNISPKSLTIPKPQLQDICIPPFHDNGNKSSFSFIGLLSSWLELEDGTPLNREISFQVLLNECKYARFAGIEKLILAPPRNLKTIQSYSQIISRLLNTREITNVPPLVLSISLPLYEDSDSLAAWELWNTIRKICNYHKSLTVSLALPKIKTPTHVLSRWLSEPVSCLLISSSVFATNQYEYPVLHKYNQNIIKKFQEINGNSQTISGELVIILHSLDKSGDQIKMEESVYVDYINYLLKRNDTLLITKNKDHNDVLSQPSLMPPLQPHKETLSNSIYSVFENDTVKYDLYEQSIDEAMLDLIGNNTMDKNLIVLIAGAGRGPLVNKVFLIAKRHGILSHIQIIALEKNPQAYLYLQKRNFDKWENKVDLVLEDMRFWSDSSIKVDLCISELLGSFGCNELSPECLWNIEKCHSKESTIFIPQSYSSYIAPISSPILYQSLATKESGLESPWVAHNIPYTFLSSKVNQLWTFKHPARPNTIENEISNFSRNMTTEFKIKHRGDIHALMGFFSAELYKGSKISIVPNELPIKFLSQDDSEPNIQKTHGMYSWSPIVFPLAYPFSVSDNTEITVLFSRVHSFEKVWYEWSLESFVYVIISDNSSTKLKYQESLSPKQNNTEDEFSSTTTSNFLPVFENGWQSVSELYQSVAPNAAASPIFNLDSAQQYSPRLEEIPEVHAKIRTGVSKLHNVNGLAFHMPL
ncbi:protein arginine N-methyltransferase NDAI_0A06610 [Naumovozyma dairenensis CBS 421]|uniref:Protein arginine N-methyltransferase n=1 Tax=Naumovozyma dairenensis (strain ATCC 10597 / BCRC 20456 / CBS 421 / NBRC 0211 / NRRL Y-12639) TaxID=1071378 RepID=G0W4S7_NAUDC|nr:hypothetical protein NDAI_0A06610 [Naumovozyma dairenensis CBS 421]CCD22815.1 hypothetical protein NDAI_0A06610 [Naumovozyma dairenensis CBS 421]